MKIEKLPSGSYRVRKTINKKVFAVVFDHKPTKNEVDVELAKLIAKPQVKPTNVMTFEEASAEYNRSKKNVLKPNTYREYTKMCERFPGWFVEMKISDITQAEINRCVNEMLIDKKPKTVRNYHAYLSSVLAVFKPELIINTTLPQKRKEEPYIPSDEEIKLILSELKNTMFYIPVVLSCYGMRRGEICALTVDDIEGDIVHIRHSLARDVNNEWIEDTTKTEESERDIIIPSNIADMIREQGYVYKGHPNSITEKLYKVQKKLGIPRFSIHKMRHYFASTLSANNVPEADILSLGGWKTDSVMKNIYRHSMMDKKENAKRNAINKISDSLFEKKKKCHVTSRKSRKTK